MLSTLTTAASLRITSVFNKYPYNIILLFQCKGHSMVSGICMSHCVWPCSEDVYIHTQYRQIFNHNHPPIICGSEYPLVVCHS